MEARESRLCAHSAKRQQVLRIKQQSSIPKAEQGRQGKADFRSGTVAGLTNLCWQLAPYTGAQGRVLPALLTILFPADVPGKAGEDAPVADPDRVPVSCLLLTLIALPFKEIDTILKNRQILQGFCSAQSFLL